eukprot:10653004-Lingulodinium_polyedra.AAC.1
MVPKINYSMLDAHLLRLTSCHVPHIHLPWPRAQIPNYEDIFIQHYALDEWIERRRVISGSKVGGPRMARKSE